MSKHQCRKDPAAPGEASAPLADADLDGVSGGGPLFEKASPKIDQTTPLLEKASPKIDQTTPLLSRVRRFP